MLQYVCDIPPTKYFYLTMLLAEVVLTRITIAQYCNCHSTAVNAIVDLPFRIMTCRILLAIVSRT